MSQPAKKGTQKSAKSAAAIGKKSKGFTDNAVVVLIVMAIIIATPPLVFSQKKALMPESKSITQSKPNFTGTWNLNLTTSKRDNGAPMSQTYESFTMTIDHKEPQLSVRQDIAQQTSRVINFSVTTDSKEHKLKVNDLPAIASAKWEGNTLVMVLRREQAQGADIETTRSATLSPDGKTMTASVKIKYADQDSYALVGTEIWEKQGELNR